VRPLSSCFTIVLLIYIQQEESDQPFNLYLATSMSHPRPTSPKPVVPPPTYEYATRTIVPNPLVAVENKFRRPPFVVNGQRVIRLLDTNDASAVQLVLALVHDCFIFTNQLHLGQVPEDAFSLRRRLLSLYIVEKDIMEYEGALRSEGLQAKFVSS
jgi:hypothetical protein